jgi:diaminohydroxyphosphoribosylaminopyrimidine deaminase/5-amino-6-(5-phosphoribosylamino)uracil reductase
MTQSEIYMQRCLQLAMLGKNRVAPNPMVGAVLLYDNKIIGEGYHENFGGAHAEVNCINNVKNENVELIPKATLYVSLEPCNHFGKTAPCVDVILQYKIKKVVVGCSDPFNKVNGKGIQRLRDNSVTVIEKILEKDCIELNKRLVRMGCWLMKIQNQ